jgi:hypothetical protein
MGGRRRRPIATGSRPMKGFAVRPHHVVLRRVHTGRICVFADHVSAVSSLLHLCRSPTVYPEGPLW